MWTTAGGGSSEQWSAARGSHITMRRCRCSRNGDRQSRVGWIADLLPHAVTSVLAGMIEQGLAAMKNTLERGRRTDILRDLLLGACDLAGHLRSLKYCGTESSVRNERRDPSGSTTVA